MRALASLLNSLYRLTNISVFKDISNSIYQVDRTKQKVDSVKRDIDRTKQAVDKTKEDL